MKISPVSPLLRGALACLLLVSLTSAGEIQDASTIAPKATNESSVPLNNNVVAAVVKDEATSTTEKPPCTNCNSDEASKLADPAAKVNLLEIQKFNGEPVTDEYAESFKAAFGQRVEASAVDERLRHFSEQVPRNSGSQKFFETSSPIGPSSIAASSVVAASDEVRPTVSEPVFAAASNDWTPIAGFQTPQLPSDFIAGYVSRAQYEHTQEPSKFMKTSAVLMDDGDSTEFSTSSSFKFHHPQTQMIRPTSVTLSVSSSLSYDSNEKGFVTEESDEAPKQAVTSHSEAKQTLLINNGTNQLNNTSTSSTVNNVTVAKEFLSVKNLTTIVPLQTAKVEALDVELVPSADSNKTLKDESKNSENESLGKSNGTKMVTKDMDESTSVQTITVSSFSDRKGLPKVTTEANKLEEVKLETQSVTPQNIPTSTVRTRRPSSGYRRRTSTSTTSTTTSTTTTSTTTTTTTEAPVITTTIPEDTMGSESSLDCTTTEGEEMATESSNGDQNTDELAQNSSTTTTVPKVSSTEPFGGRFKTRPSSSELPVEETTYMVHFESSTSENVQQSSSSESPTSQSPGDEEDCEIEEQSPAPDTDKNSSKVNTSSIPFDDVTTDIPDEVKLYLQLKVATTWEELCRTQEEFKRGLADMLSRGTKKDVSPDRVILLNDHECLEPPPETPDGISVHIYLQDENGDYDMDLTQAFPTIWSSQMDNNTLKITCADIRYARNEQAHSAGDNGSVIAAIAITGVAAGCFILLIVLMLVMRKRSKRFNYGQRCTPVSLDAYSLDSVSVYNSVRRKGGAALRASKRSYGNPNFEDGEAPSHKINFAGLANCLNDTKAIQEEFSMVPVVHARLDELPPGAEAKNRYANVIPLPETRVPLTKRGSDSLSEYINANYVRGPQNSPKYYIACQAPMEDTVSDFWRMIWEQQSKVILMLTDLEENGVEKCADYLPPSEVLDCHRLFGDFHVTLKKREERDKYVISTIQLKNIELNLWREVTHLWYFGWPSTGVPDEANAVIAFIIEARAFMKGNSGPTVVHCSPGTGRTGTIIATDLCIRDFEKSRAVDIPRVVHRLRRDRAGAVQTKEQYLFIYQVLHLYAAKLTGGAMESF